jgi:DNA-binding MarR family transcriptional regulator
MEKNLAAQQLDLRLWRQLYQSYTLLKRCEDSIYEEYGLTTEQYAVLVTISYVGEPTRISDIAGWLERSTNSISMIVDRMVRAGLVRRARDKRDRRVVYVSKTSKAESLFKPATVASFASIRNILSAIAQKDKLTLLDLLGEIKYQTLKCVNPGVDIQKIKKDELKQAVNIGKWLSQYSRPPTRETRHRGGEKEKPKC